MAKQSLPSVDSISMATEVKADGSTITTRQVTFAEPPVQHEGYVSRRVDVKLSRDAALKLRDKTRQLQDTGAKTADGRFVTNKTQAIQWIFENEVIV